MSFRRCSEICQHPCCWRESYPREYENTLSPGNENFKIRRNHGSQKLPTLKVIDLGANVIKNAVGNSTRKKNSRLLKLDPIPDVSDSSKKKTDEKDIELKETISGDDKTRNPIQASIVQLVNGDFYHVPTPNYIWIPGKTKTGQQNTSVSDGKDQVLSVTMINGDALPDEVACRDTKTRNLSPIFETRSPSPQRGLIHNDDTKIREIYQRLPPLSSQSKRRYNTPMEMNRRGALPSNSLLRIGGLQGEQKVNHEESNNCEHITENQSSPVEDIDNDDQTRCDSQTDEHNQHILLIDNGMVVKKSPSSLELNEEIDLRSDTLKNDEKSMLPITTVGISRRRLKRIPIYDHCRNSIRFNELPGVKFKPLTKTTWDSNGACQRSGSTSSSSLSDYSQSTQEENDQLNVILSHESNRMNSLITAMPHSHHSVIQDMTEYGYEATHVLPWDIITTAPPAPSPSSPVKPEPNYNEENHSKQSNRPTYEIESTNADEMDRPTDLQSEESLTKIEGREESPTFDKELSTEHISADNSLMHNVYAQYDNLLVSDEICNSRLQDEEINGECNVVTPSNYTMEGLITEATTLEKSHHETLSSNATPLSSCHKVAALSRRCSDLTSNQEIRGNVDKPFDSSSENFISGRLNKNSKHRVALERRYHSQPSVHYLDRQKENEITPPQTRASIIVPRVMSNEKSPSETPSNLSIELENAIYMDSDEEIPVRRQQGSHQSGDVEQDGAVVSQERDIQRSDEDTANKDNTTYLPNEMQAIYERSRRRLEDENKEMVMKEEWEQASQDQNVKQDELRDPTESSIKLRREKTKSHQSEVNLVQKSSRLKLKSSHGGLKSARTVGKVSSHSFQLQDLISSVNLTLDLEKEISMALDGLDELAIVL